MRVKTAIVICKNINSELIAQEDKLVAIDTLLESKQGSMNIPKPYLFDTLAWIKKQYDKQIGKWKDGTVHDGKYEREGVVCSVCGEEQDYETDYCPGCGARMVLEE